MGHATIAAYMRPEFPVDTASDSSVGTLYSYRGPTATIAANIPAIGEVWADGNPVTSRRYVPGIGNSGVSDLEVDTTYQTTSGDVISTTLESVRYQIRWVPQDLPLIQHPAFATVPSDPAEIAAILGWEAELSPALKSSLQYRELDSSGNPGTLYTVGSVLAIAYCNLRLLGFESYTVYSPVLTKVSTYRGTDAPGTGDCGGKETPSWPGYPSTYEYIKSSDQAERVGTRTRWERTEEWTGFKKVSYDNTTLYT